MTKISGAVRQKAHRLKMRPYLELARGCKRIDARLDSCHDAILDLMDILTSIDTELQGLKCSTLFNSVSDCDSDFSEDLLRKENLI